MSEPLQPPSGLGERPVSMLQGDVPQMIVHQTRVEPDIARLVAEHQAVQDVQRSPVPFVADVLPEESLSIVEEAPSAPQIPIDETLFTEAVVASPAILSTEDTPLKPEMSVVPSDDLDEAAHQQSPVFQAQSTDMFVTAPAAPTLLAHDELEELVRVQHEDLSVTQPEEAHEMEQPDFTYDTQDATNLALRDEALNTLPYIEDYVVPLPETIETHARLLALQQLSDEGQPGVSLGLSDEAIGVSFEQPVNVFEAYVATQQEAVIAEPLSLQEIQDQAATRLLEETFVQLAVHLSEESLLDVNEATTYQIIDEIAALCEISSEVQPTDSIELTVELTEKVIALVRSLGYENPEEVMVAYAEAHGTDFLLQTIMYLCRLQAQANREFAQSSSRVLLPQADPVWQRFARVLLRFMTQQTEQELSLTKI